MRAEKLEQDGMSSHEIVLSYEADQAEPGAGGLGRQLRDARESMGLTQAEAATRLKVPIRLIARLEQDEYEGMDQGVYLRGYLMSYSRLVGVSIEDAERTAAVHTRTAPLVATGTVSRSRYLFDRYSVSATYLILTALIVAPAVWLATHGGLEQNLARTTSLDAPGTIQVPLPAQIGSNETDAQNNADATAADASTEAPAAPSSNEVASAPAAQEAPKQDQMPIIASMAPFPAQSTPEPPATAPVAPEPAKTGAHALVLTLKAASWVEITADDGSKLEYGLLPAGTQRSYSSNSILSVRLGNAEGAEVRADGQSIDLTPFRRANVARLRIFGANGAEAPKTEF